MILTSELAGVPANLVPLMTALPSFGSLYRDFVAADYQARIRRADSVWITTDPASIEGFLANGPASKTPEALENWAKLYNSAQRRFEAGTQFLATCYYYFSNNIWVAYGRQNNSHRGLLGEVQRIPANIWNISLSINPFASTVVFPPGVTFYSVHCAPLILCGDFDHVEQSLVGTSLEFSVAKYVFGDFEVQSLFAECGNENALTMLAEVFAQGAERKVLLPLSDKRVIAAVLRQIISPLVKVNAEAIADVLACRFDALAYYLETLHLSWVQDGNEKDASQFGPDFDRRIDRLDLCDFSIVGTGQDARPITNIRFTLPPEARDSSEGGGKSRGGRPRMYADYLAALLSDIIADNGKAKGLTTKAAIYRKVAVLYSDANPGATKTGAQVEKSFSGDSLAQSSMECIISFAKKLP